MEKNPTDFLLHCKTTPNIDYFAKSIKPCLETNNNALLQLTYQNG